MINKTHIVILAIIIIGVGSFLLAHKSAEAIVTTVANNGQLTSVAVGSSDLPRIVYKDTITGELKLIACTNISCTSSISNIISASGDFPEVRLNAFENPVIVFYQSNSVKIATCSDALCSGTITINTIETMPLSSYAATSFDFNNNGFPVISYNDITTDDLKVAVCSNAVCSSGTIITTLDSIGGVGFGSVLKINSQGYPIIVYNDLTNNDIKLAICTQFNCSTSTLYTIYTSQGGNFLGFDLASNDNPIIAFVASSGDILRVIACQDDMCTPGSQVVTNTYTSAGISTSSYVHLVVDSGTGYPRIAFNHGSNDDMMLIECWRVDCSNSTNVIILDPNANVMSLTSFALGLTGIPALSYEVGNNVKLARYYAPVITQTGGSTGVNEQGPTSDTFSFALGSQPSNDVTVNFTLDNSQVILSTPQLIFTNSNWDIPQIVTVTAINDIIIEGLHYDYVNYVMTSADTNFDGLIADNIVVINITDNDGSTSDFDSNSHNVSDSFLRYLKDDNIDRSRQ